MEGHDEAALLSPVRVGVVGLALLAAGACGADAAGAGAASGGSGTEGATGSATAGNDGSGPATAGTVGQGGGSTGGDPPPACPEVPAPEERGFLPPGAPPAGGSLPACRRHLWWTKAAATSVHRVTMVSEVPVDLQVVYPDDPELAEPLVEAEGAAVSAVFESPRSGEFAVVVTSGPVGADYTLEIACEAGCDLVTTRFPMLFVHGWTGFASIGPLTYFYGVGDDLAQAGYPVSFAVLDPYNGVEVRAGQLAAAADDLLAAARARKLDLVAHSQGGLDGRYLIGVLGYGDRVAALATVGTPHRGTPLADIALGLAPGPSEAALAFLLETIGAGAGFDSDAEASLWAVSEAYVQGEFNPSVPDDPRVDYHSWMGRTCLSVLVCGDAVDAPIAAGYEILAAVAGENDGVVPVDSAPWGTYHGTVPADHFDEVGQVAGATSPAFDHLAFYRDVAETLAAAGH